MLKLTNAKPCRSEVADLAGEAVQPGALASGSNDEQGLEKISQAAQHCLAMNAASRSKGNVWIYPP
jgi:hypothetical protein